MGSQFKFHNLAGSPGKSCNLISFRDVQIMIDCTLDFMSTLGFMPISLIHNQKLSSLPNWCPSRDKLKNANLNHKESRLINYEVKECHSGLHCINSSPELATFNLDSFDASSIDVVLISNYLNMFGLPYLTERTQFTGIVYVTEPTYHFGRILMEEVIKLIERTPSPKRAHLWKRVYEYVNLPIPRNHVMNHDPNSWLPIYSIDELMSCLSKLKVVNFSQSLDIFGLFEVSAHSSGFCIGSCNWVLKSNHEKIVYMSQTSILTTHPKPFESQPLQDADIMILTNLTPSPLVNPDTMLGDFCSHTIQALKNEGNVLVPCYPCGMVYDLIECIASQLAANHLPTVPIYFISPVAEASLAYSNILGEWLTNTRQSKVFIPDEPFIHSSLVRAGRLKHFSSISDAAFNEAFKCPCIVFTSHPSLRFGDVVHFLQLWGQSSKNLLILTEPDFPCQEAVNPFLPLAMRILYIPIDTNWNFKQANSLLNNELRPNHLILHNNYVTKPPANYPTPIHGYSTTDLMIELQNSAEDSSAASGPISISTNQDHLAVMKSKAITSIHPYCFQDSLDLMGAKGSFERMKIDPEFANLIIQSEIRPGVSFATINGSLLARDNKYTLHSINEKTLSKISKETTLPPSHYYYGNLNFQLLLELLAREGITDATVEGAKAGKIIELRSLKAVIHIEEAQTHIITADQESRARLSELIKSCLKKF